MGQRSGGRERMDQGASALSSRVCTTRDLPERLQGLDAPFACGWTATQRVAVVAGAQNLPFYPHFSSEEDLGMRWKPAESAASAC
jgi:hypothetical protein